MITSPGCTATRRQPPSPSSPRLEAAEAAGPQPALTPLVQTDAATSVTAGSAVLNGEITSDSD